MVSKNFLVKDGLKRALQITIGLPLLLAVCILSGCVSWPTEGPSGWLTITGIEGMDGKFVTSSSYLPPPAIPPLLYYPEEVARSPATVIMNGEVRLPLYGQKGPYQESETVNVCLKIAESAEGFNMKLGNAENNFDLVYGEVQFNQGEAALKWEDQVTPGYITITNRSSEFADSNATVYIGLPGELKVVSTLLGATVQGIEGNCLVTSAQGAQRQRFFARYDGYYRRFPNTGTRDVIVVLSTATLEFKGVAIQNFTITLDLSKGVRL